MVAALAVTAGRVHFQINQADAPITARRTGRMNSLILPCIRLTGSANEKKPQGSRCRWLPWGVRFTRGGDYAIPGS